MPLKEKNNFSKEFPEVENEGYDNKTLGKKAKAWRKKLEKFNFQNPHGIKHESDTRMLEAAETPVQERIHFAASRSKTRKIGGRNLLVLPS